MDDALIIALILILMTFLGFVSNWFVVFASRKLSTSKHAFGILTANQAIVDSIFSTMFLFYICPMIISVTNTYIIVAVLCIISLIAAFGSFYVECPLSWYLETYEFDLPATDFCGFIGLNFQMPRYLFCIATVIILDILTVFRVRQFTERLQATTAPVDKKEKNSKRREMSFLKQTCSQGAVCSWELIACFYLSPMTENLWLLFFFNSVSWVAVHSFDGLATLYFNQDMNKYLKTLIFKRGKVEEVSRTRQSDAMFKVSTASRVIII